jgi:hypothetical protein
MIINKKHAESLVHSDSCRRYDGVGMQRACSVPVF